MMDLLQPRKSVPIQIYNIAK